MFITGPQVIKQVTGETVTADDLGGPVAQMNNSGVVNFIAANDQEALYLCRRLLGFLPSNKMEDPPRLPQDLALEPNPELNRLVPVESKVGYDMRTVIPRVLDQNDLMEVQAGFAPNIIIWFGRIQGRLGNPEADLNRSFCGTPLSPRPPLSEDWPLHAASNHYKTLPYLTCLLPVGSRDSV